MIQKASLAHSRFFLFFLGGLIALAPFSIDTYLPGLPTIAEDFGSDMVAANLTMTTFLIGYGIGQFFGGSLSDQLGRKPIGLFGLATFLVSSLLIASASGIGEVHALRFTQAIGGGFASVICLAQVRDIYPPGEVSTRIATVIMVVLVAPLIAPALGALLLQFGWQWIFYFLSLYAFVFFLVYLTTIPETRSGPRMPLSAATLFAGYVSVIRHRLDGRLIAVRYCLFSAFTAGIFMSFLTNASHIYMQIYGLNEFEFSLAFGANALALMIGNRLVVRLIGRFATIRLLKFANLAQIVLLTVAVVLLAMGQANFWTIYAVLLSVIGLNGAINPAASGAFIALFDRNSGSAASLIATLIFLLGSLFGALAAITSGGSLLPIFAVMLLAALLARGMLMSIEP